MALCSRSEAVPATFSTRREIAGQIWDRSTDVAGTTAEDYIRNRGIIVRLPSMLRFSYLKHGPSGRVLPTIIACVEREPSRDLVAVHRTYLNTDGTDKADVDPQRMMLGSVKGGCVWLTPQRSTIMIAEGIETALSLHQARPDIGERYSSGIYDLRLEIIRFERSVRDKKLSSKRRHRRVIVAQSGKKELSSFEQWSHCRH